MTLLPTIALCFAAGLLQLNAADDIILADFEAVNYGNWKTTGEAFGTEPAHGALPGQMNVEGFKGKGLASSFHKGDASTGTLTSPPFKIERKFIGFLIGGGKNEEKTCLNLLVDGKVVRNATGPNDKPGGSENLEANSWDVTDLAGKVARIQIVDTATGGWGHISVDHLSQTDSKPAQSVTNATRELKIEKQFLNIPIKNGAAKRVITTLIDGKKIVRNDVELADGAPDWWAFVDVSAWKGMTITLQVNKLGDNSTGLSSIDQTDAIKDSDNLYKEALRPQFHFSSRRGWLNDPNGMVFFNNEYHLFYQHNPYGWPWGNMHWGHAVSKDMVHWQELALALAPDEMGPMFSGSAVVDWKNTSGFGKDGKPPMVLFYTAAGKPTVQGIAYSLDGRTFTKYSGNPVVKEFTDGNRDPKVIWHEPSKKWIMTLYVELKSGHTIHFLTSANLKDWTLSSIVPGFFECPDFFELAVDGNAANKKWVLLGANSDYSVGSFDGTTYSPETPILPGQRGRDFYAAQTFSDIPETDGRRIQIGWFRTVTPGMPFNQSMSIPLELKLTATPDGPRMTWTPVKELESLRGKTHALGSFTLTPESANPFENVKAELVELDAEFEPGIASEISFNVRGTRIRYHVGKQEIEVNGQFAPAPLKTGKQQLKIICDRTGLEAFASQGRIFVPLPVNLKADDLNLGVRVKAGSVKFDSLTIHELQSAWR